MLYMTDPSQSLIQLQNLLDLYGTVSGYNVHYNKSEILPLTTLNFSEFRGVSAFKWSPMGVKYLGTNVDNNLQNLYK